jgi:hypothetical protein
MATSKLCSGGFPAWMGSGAAAGGAGVTGRPGRAGQVHSIYSVVWASPLPSVGARRRLPTGVRRVRVTALVVTWHATPGSGRDGEARQPAGDTAEYARHGAGASALAGSAGQTRLAARGQDGRPGRKWAGLARGGTGMGSPGVGRRVADSMG